MEELYDFLTKLEEDTLKIDEKRMEELFGELNDEQNNFISEVASLNIMFLDASS